MAEMNGSNSSNANDSSRQLTVRHRGRIAQIGIYFGKFTRMFVYQSDWKVLPMAALIAGLVGFALGVDFGINMEGTLTATFAIVCVCIWNGSFNSIQVVCRERDVIKREHRSGMHISSYILAHMMYQLLLCLAQTVVTILVLYLVGMKFTGSGMFTPWRVVDVGITMLLVTYAADMISLWISTLVHSTTTAMTIMPFVLIFQLIFSGGMFTLPKVVDPVVMLTISSPGLKAMASQTQINDLPYAAVSGMIHMVDDVEIGGKVTLGQVLDLLSDDKNNIVAELRSIPIENEMTLRDICRKILEEEKYADLRSKVLIDNITVEAAIEALLEKEELDEVLDSKVSKAATFGEVVDAFAANETVQKYRQEGMVIHMTVGDAIDLIGREETINRILEKASEEMYEPKYAYTKENIIKNWIHILVFAVVFALLSIVTLEFIDKDKR